MGNNTLIAFDPDPIHLGLVKTFKATSAILRGSVVSFATAGASRTVEPATTSTGMPIGVALNSQATVGGEVTVAMQGSVVKVLQQLDNTAMDAGHYVTSGATAGTVAALDPAVKAHAGKATEGAEVIGITLDDFAGTAMAYGYILINPSPRWALNA